MCFMLAYSRSTTSSSFAAKSSFVYSFSFARPPLNPMFVFVCVCVCVCECWRVYMWMLSMAYVLCCLQVDEHIANVCVKTVIPCKFARVGTGCKAKVSDRQSTA